MTNSHLFHRKPSCRGYRGELWLAWAGARAALLLSWGSFSIKTSGGVPVEETSLRPRLPAELRGWCQTLPTCPLWDGDGSGEISRHYLAPGCPPPRRHSQGLCCQRPPKPTGDKRQRGTEPTSLQSLPPPSRVIWLRHLGSPTGYHRGPGLALGGPLPAPTAQHPWLTRGRPSTGFICIVTGLLLALTL